MYLPVILREQRVTHLVVLTLEQLPPCLSQKSTDHSDLRDALDASCVCLEQFYSQDVRRDAPWPLTFGGPDRLRSMAERLAEQGVDRKLVCVGDGQQVNDSLGFATSRATADPQAAIQELQATGANSPADRQLTWCHATRGVTDDGLMALLKSLLAMPDHPASATETSTAFIVTGCRGAASDTPRGPASGADESLLRVPVWIGLPQRALIREQALLGSHCLPDIIEQILDTVTSSSDSPLTATTWTILGDEFRAVRSAEAMLVQPTTSPGDAQCADSPHADADSVQLYLKPEDVWNIHDQAAVYVELRDELTARLPDQPGN